MNWKSKQEMMKKLEKSQYERQIEEREQDLDACMSKIRELVPQDGDEFSPKLLVKDMLRMSNDLRHLSETVHGIKIELEALVWQVESLNAEISEIMKMKKMLESLYDRHKLEVMKEEMKEEIALFDEIGGRRRVLEMVNNSNDRSEES
jgi:prefoldin subunit 5